MGIIRSEQDNRFELVDDAHEICRADQDFLERMKTTPKPHVSAKYSSRAKYTPELLQSFADEHSICLTYEGTEKLDRQSKIIGVCTVDGCHEKFEKGFRVLCRNKVFLCKAHASEAMFSKTIETNILRYGTPYSCNNEEIKKKRDETNLLRYGTVHTFQNEEVKNKIVDTNLERYGKRCALQNEDVKKKRDDTNIARYGTANPMQNEEVKQKGIETNMLRYGVANPFQNDQIKLQIAETNIARYGTANPIQNEEVQQKRIETNMIRYGTPFAVQNAEVKKKKDDTNMARYGTTCVMQNEEVQQKAAETMLSRYGVAHALQYDEFKQKFVETSIARYGTSHPFQNDDVKRKITETNIARYGVANAMQNAFVAEKGLKNSFRNKKYVFIDGTIQAVQGYEPFALALLERKGFHESDLITSRLYVPEIWYMDTHQFKCRRYFVDIYIPKDNKMIEVKSTFTYMKDIAEITWKKEACVRYGFDFEVWVFDYKQNLLFVD